MRTITIACFYLNAQLSWDNIIVAWTFFMFSINFTWKPMDFMDFYFYYVKVFLKALNPLCLKTTHSCGMCNCVYFCCWVSKNVYLATFPEAVNVRNIYLGLFFMYLSVPANDPLAQKKKKKRQHLTGFFLWWDMWRRTAVCLILADFRCSSQLSFGHVQHEKNGNVELICFPF